MYAITRLVDGRWHCSCRIQDGTERWHEPTRAEAVAAMVQAAKVMNGATIAEADIDFYRQEVGRQGTCVVVETVAEPPAAGAFTVTVTGGPPGYASFVPLGGLPPAVCYDRSPPGADVGVEKAPPMSWLKRVLLWAAARID